MEDLPATFVEGFHDEKDVRKMVYNDFGYTGMKVSKLSIGTGVFCYAYNDVNIEECKKTILEALKRGINYIDTAPYYGHGESESVLGMCLEGIPRQAYYLATKIGRYEKDPKLQFDFTAKKTKESIDKSLERLKLDYVDVLQVHDIEFAPNLDLVLNETLPAVQEIVRSGKARFIGVTGYPVRTLAECVQKSRIKIDMVLSYSRQTMFDNSLEEFLPILKEKNLGIVNAAANGLGLLSNLGERSWHEATQHIKEVCKEAREICKKNDVELGKLAVWHSLQQKGPDTILVGMDSVKIVKYNFDVLHNGLTEKENSVYQEVMRLFAEKFKETHWEGIEVQKYWKTVRGE